MIVWRKLLAASIGLFLTVSVRAEVRVFLQDSNGVALVKYECTAGEVVRAFALDISVDRGQIVSVFGFFRGDSRVGNTGYGIFPRALRDYVFVNGNTNLDWESIDYTPLASVQDRPADTLPGLNSPGVTLELGGLWDPNTAEAIPAATGTLCALGLSQSANVSVGPNLSRGGVVSAFPESVLHPVFSGAFVGPSILSATLQYGFMTVLFSGGELQTASSVAGPWTDTGNFSGSYTESVETNRFRFYRVRAP